MKRHFSLIALIFVLPNCVVSNMKDTAQLGYEEGVLALTVFSSEPDLKLIIFNKDNKATYSTILEVTQGATFRVVAMPAGEYIWHGVRVRGEDREFSTAHEFTIIDHAINYIGDMHIDIDRNLRKYRLAFIDRNFEAMQHLREGYPVLSRSHRYIDALATRVRTTVAQEHEDLPPEHAPGLEMALIAKLASLRDELCLCHDGACTKRLGDAFQSLRSHMQHTYRHGISEQGARRFTEIVGSLRQCTSTIDESSSPPAGVMLREPDAVPPLPAPPQNVSPTALEAERIAGETNIVPDDATRADILASGRRKVVGSYKLCIDAAGSINTVTQLRGTGFPAYDSLIQNTIRGEWRYLPFMNGGKPVAVCTAVTFIYSVAPNAQTPSGVAPLHAPS